MAGFAQVAVLRQGGADSDSASARPGRRAAAGGPPAVRVRRRGPAVAGPRGPAPVGRRLGWPVGRPTQWPAICVGIVFVGIESVVSAGTGIMIITGTGPGAGMSRSVCACMCSYDKTNTPKMSKYEMKVCACMCMYLLVPSQYLHVSAGIMSVCACMCSYYKTITLKMSKYEL